ncbi:Outer membrane protein assembly factor BamB [uncultured archaeon]|nr:Outer membrane protein assembly factor BamB [uncultured archaeon]
MAVSRPLNLSKFAENGGVAAKPLIIDGIIYIGAMDTFFYAIDSKTGKKKWAYKTNGPILATAVSDEDAIYFTSFDNYLYAISFEGKLLWKFKTNGIIASSPRIMDTVVYFGSSDYNLYAVDTKTHAELWHFRTGDEIVSDPIIVDKRIYFGSMDSYFYCLGLNGNLIWKFKANDAILMGQAASDERGIYFGSADETLYAVDFDGNLRWGFRTAEQVYNTAIARDGRVYFTGRDRYFYCLDAKTGACVWKFRVEVHMFAPPVIRNSQIFFGAEKIYCLNMGGYKVWEIPLESIGIGMNGTVFKENVIFSCFDCNIRSITFDGKLNWIFRTNGVIAPLESFLQVLTPPKWDPRLFDPETVRRTVNFDPYAFSKDSGLKIYGGLDTTGIEAYAGIPRDIGAYMEKRGSAAAYIDKGKKKKTKLQEILEEQAKREFGV